MAKATRRGLLKFITFGAFEAAVMKTAGVTSPTQLVATPKTVFMITTPALDNSDEGWYSTEGESVARVFVDEQLAQRECKRLNRLLLRGDHTDNMSSDSVDNTCYWDGTTDEMKKRLKEMMRPYFIDDDTDEEDIDDYDSQDFYDFLADRLGDGYGLPFDDDTPDAVLDFLLDCISFAGEYEVNEHDLADLDPEIVKGLGVTPQPAGSLSGTPAATAPA